MTYEKDTDLDINSIQEENLKMLQESMDDSLLSVNNQETPIQVENAKLEKVEPMLVEEKEVEVQPEIEDVLNMADESEQEVVLDTEEAVKSVELTEEKSESEIKVEASIAQKSVKNITDKNKSVFQKIISTLGFIFRYTLTASFIFILLMAFSNYSAYITIAKSYLNPEAIIESEKNIKNSIEQSQIEINYEEDVEDDESREEAREKVLEKREKEIYESKDIRRILGDIREEEISLDIEIIPFVNRLIIPKIGKNVPLIDIEQGNVEGLDELNDIFMEELEDGIVRYPGSAAPGEFGNSFLFGHSSNFPWMPGDYNDVFALLDKLEIGDEVITYYEGQKYTYKIKQKEVIHPNDVSVLKRETNKKEMTLMTCWPIGTTYNRLLVIGELVN